MKYLGAVLEFPDTVLHKMVLFMIEKHIKSVKEDEHGIFPHPDLIWKFENHDAASLEKIRKMFSAMANTYPKLRKQWKDLEADEYFDFAEYNTALEEFVKEESENGMESC